MASDSAPASDGVRNVLVIGGASGLGEAMVKSFARAGKSVILADISREAGFALERQLVGEGFRYVNA